MGDIKATTFALNLTKPPETKVASEEVKEKTPGVLFLVGIGLAVYFLFLR